MSTADARDYVSRREIPQLFETCLACQLFAVVMLSLRKLDAQEHVLNIFASGDPCGAFLIGGPKIEQILMFSLMPEAG
uniref:Uncharacterized protein n=1 Tax=Sphaerodactylus townsendi TaxID=933632 RepID=A0ACB8F033_9SAUR